MTMSVLKQIKLEPYHHELMEQLHHELMEHSIISLKENELSSCPALKADKADKYCPWSGRRDDHLGYVGNNLLSFLVIQL